MNRNFQPLDDVINELRDIIETEVAAGFLDPHEVVECAVELLGDDADPVQLRAAATRLTEVMVAAHTRAQANWPAVTDCDRLDAAFAELERRGIVARHNFSCCQSCGASEIWEEVDEAEAEDREIRGFTFYHQQDTEGAVQGGGLHLAYQSTSDAEGASEQIGHEIVEVLRKHGLEPEWNGSVSKRIRVPMDWKRRRA